MRNKTKTAKKQAGLSVYIIGGVVCFLLLFGAAVMTVGYVHLKSVLVEQYKAQAESTASIAATLVNADDLEQYAQNRADNSATQADSESTDLLAAEQDVRIFVVPAGAREQQMEFAFNAAAAGQDDAMPFVPSQRRQIGDDSFREAIDSMHETGVSSAFLQQKGENGNTVIACISALTGSDGEEKGFLCVEYDMQMLDQMRRNYIGFMLAVSGVLTVLTVWLVWIYLRRRIVLPIASITQAATRFAGNPRDDASALPEPFSPVRELNALATSLNTMERDTLRYMDNLTAAAAERERMDTELQVAGSIQSGLLPAAFPPYPEHPEFSIYACMQPAKEIGGDFYDFFLQDDDHLAIVMADVSGKGIPAALFMTAAKVTLNVCAMKGGTPSAILQEANDRICESNAEDMFVTVWLGILELSTGRLLSANAGHEDPMLRRNGRFALEKTRHGLVLGAMPHVRFTDVETHLHAGDALFLYTDGVSDAMNREEAMFGLAGIENALNADPSDDPQHILQTVRDAVESFIDGAPQFDDVTMLCLRYAGRTDGAFRIAADNANLPQAMAYIDGVLERADCPPKAAMQIGLAAEELFANVAMYAYRGTKGDVEIEARVSDDGVVTVTFADSGVPYNPLEKEDPDVTLSAEERQIGGLGIFLVKKNMDDVDYRYTDGQNRVTIRKRIR